MASQGLNNSFSYGPWQEVSQSRLGPLTYMRRRSEDWSQDSWDPNGADEPALEFIPTIVRRQTWHHSDLIHAEPFDGPTSSDTNAQGREYAAMYSIPAYKPPLSREEFTICENLAIAIRLRVAVIDEIAVNGLRPMLLRFDGERHDQDADAFLDRAEQSCRTNPALQGSNDKLRQVSLRKIGEALAMIPLIPGIRRNAVVEFSQDLEEVFDEVYRCDLQTHFNEHFMDTMYEFLHSRGWLDNFLELARQWRQRRRDNRRRRQNDLELQQELGL